MFEFLQAPLLAGILVSIACGVMGSLVTVQKIDYMAGGIAHSVLGGMGAAVYFGFSPLIGALGAALIAALFIGYIKLYWQDQEETLISAVWAIGMSIGLLFIQASPGYQNDLMDYLFGNILLVSSAQLIETAVLDALIMVILWLWHRPLIAVAFDQEFSQLRGIPVHFFYLLLLSLIAITVVLLVQVVGLILLIALLSLPAAIAAHYTKTLKQMMLLASLLGMVFSSSGIGLSYYLDQPTGPIIILITGSIYILSVLIKKR